MLAREIAIWKEKLHYRRKPLPPRITDRFNWLVPKNKNKIKEKKKIHWYWSGNIISNKSLIARIKWRFITELYYQLDCVIDKTALLLQIFSCYFRSTVRKIRFFIYLKNSTIPEAWEYFSDTLHERITSSLTTTFNNFIIFFFYS